MIESGTSTNNSAVAWNAYITEVLGVRAVVTERRQHADHIELHPNSKILFVRKRDENTIALGPAAELFAKVKAALKLNTNEISTVEYSGSTDLEEWLNKSSAKVIVLLGRQATDEHQLSSNSGANFLSTIDPVVLLTDENQKRPFWNDLKKALEILNA